MQVTVTVMLKNGVLDPQGEAVKSALGTLGFSGINGVRQGKIIVLDVDDGVDGEEYRADTGNSTGQSGVSEIHHHVHHHYTHTHTHIHHHHEPQVDVNIFRNFDENPGQSQRAKKLKQPPANFAEIAINNSSN